MEIARGGRTLVAREQVGHQSDALLTETVDHCVFADLRGLAEREDAEESRALEAGWMTDLVELAHTPQLVHQIRDIADTAERQHQRSALHGLRQLTPDSAAVTERSGELLQAVTRSPGDVTVDDLRRCLRVRVMG
jgi:hypothetical protein